MKHIDADRQEQKTDEVVRCKNCCHYNESMEADERCLHPFGFSCQHFNEMLESNQK